MQCINFSTYNLHFVHFFAKVCVCFVEFDKLISIQLFYFILFSHAILSLNAEAVSEVFIIVYFFFLLLLACVRERRGSLLSHQILVSFY